MRAFCDCAEFCLVVRIGTHAARSTLQLARLSWGWVRRAMKYSCLATVLCVLQASFGPCRLENGCSDFQEEFAGQGLLTAGVRQFELVAKKRDAP